MYNCEVIDGHVSASQVYSDKPYGHAKNCNFSGVDIDMYSEFENCNITGLGYNNNPNTVYRNCNMSNISINHDSNSSYNCVILDSKLYRGHYVNCTISGENVSPSQLYLTNCTLNGVYYDKTAGMG